MNKRLSDRVRKAVMDGIYRNAERIFDISQQTDQGYVPVDRGTLKKSGIVFPIQNGARLQYRTNYSWDVEGGVQEDRPIVGDQIVKIKTYKRRDGTVVNAHEIVYHNKKLISLRPKKDGKQGFRIYRVINKIKKRPGVFFLTRAVKVGLLDLTGDIKFFLSRVGKVS